MQPGVMIRYRLYIAAIVDALTSVMNWFVIILYLLTYEVNHLELKYSDIIHIGNQGESSHCVSVTVYCTVYTVTLTL